jgi:broad specificity phosphatase PhoE
MSDLGILEFIIQAKRAVTIDSILAVLTAKRLSATSKRAALVTKLNRLKEGKFLDWSRETRVQDIKITEAGRDNARSLRDRILTNAEIEFLDEK